MQPLHLKNILLLLSFCPVQISRPRRPYPRHWKLNQRIPLQPRTLGEQIKKHRLELHWLQSSVAAKIGTSSASVSNWERGITTNDWNCLSNDHCTKVERCHVANLHDSANRLNLSSCARVDCKKVMGQSSCQKAQLLRYPPERCLSEWVCK